MEKSSPDLYTSSSIVITSSLQGASLPNSSVMETSASSFAVIDGSVSDENLLIFEVALLLAFAAFVGLMYRRRSRGSRRRCYY